MKNNYLLRWACLLFASSGLLFLTKASGYFYVYHPGFQGNHYSVQHYYSVQPSPHYYVYPHEIHQAVFPVANTYYWSHGAEPSYQHYHYHYHPSVCQWSSLGLICY